MNSSDVDAFLNNYRRIEHYHKIYASYMYVMLLVSTVLTAFLLYRIHTNPKLSTDTRCVFLNFGWTSYGVTLVKSLWLVIPSSPMSGGYSTNLSIFAFFGRDGFFIATMLVWSLSMQLGIICTVGFSNQAYRLRLSESGKFARAVFEWFETDNNTRNFLNCSLIIHIIILSSGCIVAKKEMIDIDSIPALASIIEKHPSLVIVNLVNNKYLIFIAILFILILCFEAGYCVQTNLVSFKAVKASSKVVQDATLAIQLRLYRLFSIQLFIMFVFMLFPLLVAIIRFLNILNVEQLSLINMCLFAWHCPLQSILILRVYPRKKSGPPPTSTVAFKTRVMDLSIRMVQ